MDATQIEESAGTGRAEQFDTPRDQPAVSFYMPGTPTVSFVEYVELAIKMLIGR
ncbi:hypothetical protein [Natrinema halophilum]|uniref:Uncharacterized protein n=1 Tax=Natrinema halophilum TaxID=1699371 RepID=A0A7D5KCI0_9EURY|nr:hypothetical protein [Natrinema halophilum]QLG48641.1 hypothetical protein HYG82_07160 [Natrinema halophilum]